MFLAGVVLGNAVPVDPEKAKPSLVVTAMASWMTLGMESGSCVSSAAPLDEDVAEGPQM